MEPHSTGYLQKPKSIYLIFNQDNGKGYVGCTGRKADVRVNDHISSLLCGSHTNKLMQEDFSKRKREFIWIELESGLYGRDAYQAETDWMIRLKTYLPEYGYNYKDCQMYRNGKPIGKLKKYLEKGEDE